MLDISRRAVEPELLDTRPQTKEALDGALDFLELTNRRFGGAQVMLSRFDDWRARWPADRLVRVLDVGTGSGDMPRAIVGWAARRHLRVHVTGLELVPSIAAIARARLQGQPGTAILEGNLFDLAATGATFDYVIASLLLHHVDPPDTCTALAALDRLAEHGLIVSDLQRTWSAYLVIGAVSWLFGNAMVRHDGPVSVRRAFRAHELEELARAAGLGYLVARDERYFRISLSGEKPGAW
jgi:2-polyprenyl-3-methyl-5-hydroxy-6-metoxy-1,4-benzoquinol methylase